MRHWQPVHHARWHDFLAGIAATLRGEALAPARATLPVLAAPPLTPAPAPDRAPAPAPAFIPTAPSAEIGPQPVPLAVAAITLEPEPAPPGPVPVPTPEPATLPEAVTFVPPVPAPIQAAVVAAPAARSDAPASARAFFAGLGWTGDKPRFAAQAAAPRIAPVSPVAPVIVATTAPAAAATGFITSVAYFRSLPWKGGVVGELIHSIRVTASRDDARLDPRTATMPGDNPLLAGMLSAARTSDRFAAETAVARPPAPALARAYFNALPWTRA